MNCEKPHKILGKGGFSMKQEYKGLYEKFGLNVVYYRKRKKLTQLQLAELVDITAATSAQSNWETWVFLSM